MLQGHAGGQCQLVLLDRGSHLSSGTPRLGKDMSVPHVAPLHTVDGDNSRPCSRPCARRDHPWCRRQLGGSKAAAWGSPGQTQARYNESQKSCLRGASTTAALGLPPFIPAPAAPQNRQLLTSSRLGTPFPMGHPKCFRTWLLGGPSGMCGCMLAGRIGSREGARGALAGRGGRGGQYTHAALPILQPSPGQDGAPCNAGVSVSQLQPVKMLS